MHKILFVRAALIACAHVAAATVLTVAEKFDAEAGTIDRETAEMMVRHHIAEEHDGEVLNPAGDDLDAMTVAQLRSTAALEAVDLGEATRKAELQAIIRQVRAGRAD